MTQWFRFDDKLPKIGTHIFALGNNDATTGNQWMWWGFYNADRKDGRPDKKAIYWCKMPPLPIMPLEEEEKKEEPVEAPKGKDRGSRKDSGKDSQLTG